MWKKKVRLMLQATMAEDEEVDLAADVLESCVAVAQSG